MDRCARRRTTTRDRGCRWRLTGRQLGEQLADDPWLDELIARAESERPTKGHVAQLAVA